jgi:hypothetical protein
MKLKAAIEFPPAFVARLNARYWPVGPALTSGGRRSGARAESRSDNEDDGMSEFCP